MTYLLFCVFLVVIDVTINHASLYMCFHCKNHCNLLNPGLTGVACQIHRRPERGQPGAVASPLEFENDDVICSFRAKYPKIFAPWAPAEIFPEGAKSRTL